MKTIKLFLVLAACILSFAKVQGQIQLYQIEPADSSWNVLISNDTLGQLHNFPKYVPFSDLIPLDTVFRSGDSVCLQFAYQNSPVCFELPDSSNTQNLAIVRDGDTIRLSISGGNEVAWRDSTRSDVDIAKVARDSVDLEGVRDSIEDNRIAIDAIAEIDTVVHIGDSIRVVLDNGQYFTVRDSFRTDQEIEDLADGAMVNIYNSDGSLTGHRTMSLDFHNFLIDQYGLGGTSRISMNNIPEIYIDVTSQSLAKAGIELNAYTPYIRVHTGQNHLMLEGNQYLKLIDQFNIEYREVVQVDSIYRQGDSLYIDFDNGTTTAVRDSFLSIEDAATIAKDSVPTLYNSDGTLTESRIVTIDGWEMTWDADDGSWQVYKPRSGNVTGQIVVSDKLAMEEVNSSNYPDILRAGFTVEDMEIKVYDGTDLSALDPSKSYYLKLADADGTVMYAPIEEVDLSGIRDTILIHQDSIDNYDVRLIALADSIAQHRIDIDAISEVEDFYHIGDSARLELSDGRIYTVRDSFLSKQDVATIARDSIVIPETDLSGIRDSIQNNIDSIADHRTDIDQNDTDITILNDSIDQHRIDIDDISEVENYYHTGDSARLELSDGRTYTVRDSFRTDAEISDLVDEGMVNIYNSDGVIDDGTRTVEFGHILKYQSSSSIGQVQYVVQDGSGDNYVMAGTIGAIQEAYVEGDINFQRVSQGGVYVVSIQNTSTGNYSGYGLYPDKMLLIPSQDISSLDSTSNYFLKLMDGQGMVKYRPIIQVDTLYHSNDSIHLGLDDGSILSVRDSFLTPGDVMDVIGDSLDIVAVDTLIHTGDSIQLKLSDGAMFTVRDSFLSRQDVAQIARDSVEIPDMVNIYNSDGALTGHRTVNTQGYRLWFSHNSGGVNTTFGVNNDDVMMYTANESNLKVAGIQTTGYNRLLIFDGETPLGSYPDSTANYFLKLMDDQGTVKYRPVIQVDTFYRSGDSIYLSLDDGSILAARDSFLTPGDVMDVVGDSMEVVTVDTLVHVGDSIRLEMSDGGRFTVRDSFLSKQDVATIARDSLEIPEGTRLIDVTHLGDSVRFEMSDASHFTVRDSAMDASAIQKWISDSIPSTVFYIDADGDQYPVEWGDVVEIDGSTVILNKPADIVWDSIAQTLYVCQYYISVDTTINEVIEDYIQLDGSDDPRSGIGKPIDLPIEIDFIYETSGSTVWFIRGGSTQNINIGATGSGTAVAFRDQNSTYISEPFNWVNGERYNVQLLPGGSGAELYINGEFIATSSKSSFMPLTTYFWLTSAYGTRFKGKVFSLTVAEEHYPIDEGSGTVINDEGGLYPMDLRGATWGVLNSSDTTIVVDTLYMCDTINLSADTYLDTAIYSGDTLYLHMNSGDVYKAEIIASGHDGKSLEFNWDGTELGIRQEGDPSYDYVDLEGPQGPQGVQGIQGVKGDQGDPGPGLEYDWDGTELGVRVEGDPIYNYVDLQGPQGIQGEQGIQGPKGDQGEKGDPGVDAILPDTVLFVNSGDSLHIIRWNDTITIDSATLILPDSSGLSYISDNNQLVYSTFVEGAWVYDTIQLNADTSIYAFDGTIGEDRNVGFTNGADITWNLDESSSFGIQSPDFGTHFLMTEFAKSIILTTRELDGARRYQSEISTKPNTTDIRSQVFEGATEVKHSYVAVDTFGVRLQLDNSRETDFLPGKEYFLKAMDSSNYVVWDTLPPSSGGLTDLDPDQIVYGAADGTAEQSANLNYKDGGVQIGTTDKTGHRISLRSTPNLLTGQDTSIIHISGVSTGTNQGQTVNGIRMDWNGNKSNSIFKGMALDYVNTTGTENYALLMEGKMKMSGGAVNPRSLTLDTEITNGLSTERNFFGINNILRLPNKPGNAGNQTFELARSVLVAGDLVATRSGTTADISGFASRMNFAVADPRVRAYGLRIAYGGAGASAMQNLYGIYQDNSFVKNYFNGSVGIGTNSPTRKLDVTGNVRLRGHIYDSNNSDGSGLTNAVLGRDAGGIVWRSDGDNDDTNELDIMQAYTGTNTVRLIPSYNEFRITGSNGISVSSSYSGGSVDRFTWNISGAGLSSDSYTMTKNSTTIDFKKNGALQSNIHFAGTGGINVHGNTAATITIDGSGIGSKWTNTAGGIYRNGGVGIGIDNLAANTFRVNYPQEMTNGAELRLNNAGTSGKIYATTTQVRLESESGHDIVIDAKSGTRDDVHMNGYRLNLTSMSALVFGQSTSGTSGTIFVAASNFSLGTGGSGSASGTFKIVINTAGSSITGHGATIPPGHACAFVLHSGTWYPLVN